MTIDIETGAFYGCPDYQLGLGYRDVIEVGEPTGEALSTPERHVVIYEALSVARPDGDDA